MNTRKLYVVPGLIAASLLPSLAAAQGGNIYGGIGVHNSYFVSDSSTNVEERDTSETSFGVNFGYRYMLTNQLFVAGELFYLNTAQDKTYSNGDKIELGDQFGAKVNLGYEWQNGFSLYGTTGFSYLDYDLQLNGDRAEDNSFVPLMGAGIGYRLNPTLSTQLELTTLGDEVNIAGDTDKSIGVVNIRLAMNYDF